jgi:hypothetical protein
MIKFEGDGDLSRQRDLSPAPLPYHSRSFFEIGFWRKSGKKFEVGINLGIHFYMLLK